MSLPTVPTVSLRQLQYIVAVAEHGGFRRAAEACHVAQPSLSAQVALAEELLGVRLFERDRRHVRLSPAGEAVVEQAQRVLVAASDLRDLAQQFSDPFRGRLRLGVIPTVGPYILPEITPVLARTFPDLTLLWSEERTSVLMHELNDGGLDGAIVALEANIGECEHAMLGRDPFVLAASPHHPLVRSHKAATLQELDGAAVLLLDDGHCFREQVLNLCTRARAKQMTFRATSLSTLVQMASAGTGVTLLPSMALPVENRRSQLRVRTFAPPGPARTLALAWRRGSVFRMPLNRVAETIRAALAQMRPVTPRPPRR
jgi:LysR family transcriptional regulator, hydrogen peroxide-inducible genes activator